MAVYIAAPFLLLGVLMYTRGLIYTLKPEGAMAKKRQQRNLKRGMTTDMRVFGRKVRRLGFMLALIAGAAIAWSLSDVPPDTDTPRGEPALEAAP